MRETTFKSVETAEDLDTVAWVRQHTSSLHKKINRFLAYSPYPAEEFIQEAYETAITVKPRAKMKGISFDRYFWKAYHKTCCKMAPLPSVHKLTFAGPKRERAVTVECLFCGAILAVKPSRTTKKGVVEEQMICTSCQTAIPKEYYQENKGPCHVEEYRDAWESHGETSAPPSLAAELVNDFYINSMEDRLDAYTYRLADLNTEEFVKNESLNGLSDRQKDILNALLETKGSTQQVAERFNVVKQTIQKTRQRALERFERKSENHPLISNLYRR